ncbi:hypothetical protein HPY31_20365 [Brevibacillus sp. HB1.3]|uniref:hypothetical protein n=1 Tax=Brevibacillus sp. HB1.3 TaxID=2738842 RepID=UPI0015569A43|nr:hypothetical protein [Brevibacillus sp. HB1.3]NQF16239.1 hypothetical protein [Brevibacillus sp. HB1.3]
MLYQAKTNWMPDDPVTEHDFNRIEQGIKNAYSEVTRIKNRTMRTEVNLLGVAIELETLKGAVLNGLTKNIFIETFMGLEDVKLLNGSTKHDSVNEKVYLA